MVTVQSVDLPAVEPLAERLPHRLLDCLEERAAASLRARPPAGTSRPLPIGAGSTRSPTVARNGLGASSMISTAAPVPTGRSTQIVVVSRNSTSMPNSCASVCLDDLLLHLAVERDEHLLPDVVLPEVDQRVLLGELGQGAVQRARSAAVSRHDDRLQRRRREVVVLRAGSRGSADRVADPDLAEPPELADLAGGDRSRRDGRAAVEDADRRDLRLAVAAESHADRASAACPENMPDIGDLLSGRAALDLEHGARDGTVGVAGPWQAAIRRCRRSARSTPAPVMAEPKNTGCTSPCPVCAASASPEPAVRDRRLVLDDRRPAARRRGRRAARPACP